MSGGAGRILVVEDDDSLREALERLLLAAGLEERGFASAEALLAERSSSEASCVVSDIRLPEISRLELLDEMHRRGWRSPVILITAHDLPGLRAESLERGAAAFLTKPFTGTDLLATIAEVTGRAGSGAVQTGADRTGN